jgi:hypothetical protein
VIAVSVMVCSTYFVQENEKNYQTNRIDRTDFRDERDYFCLTPTCDAFLLRMQRRRVTHARRLIFLLVFVDVVVVWYKE